jgi:hypothetical protein
MVAGIGQYKLLRTLNGNTAFAWVEVSVDRKARETPLVTASLSLDCEMAWIDAAIIAAERCLTMLQARGVADASDRLVLERVVGSANDTTSDAVEAASVIAVAAAFGLRDDFVLSHDGRWRVDSTSLRERFA